MDRKLLESLGRKSKEAFEKARSIREEWEKKGEAPPDTVLKEVDDLLTKAQEFKDQADAELKRLTLEEGLEKFHSTPVTPHQIGDDKDAKAVDKVDTEFKAIETYIRHRGKVDMLEPDDRKALSSFVDSSGGFWTGTEFSSEVLTQLHDIMWMRQVCRTMQIGKKSLEFPAGGITGTFAWRVDGQTTTAMTLSTPAGKATFKPNSIDGLLQIPDELLDDADFDLRSYLQRELAIGLQETQEAAFIAGTGVGQPLGLLNSDITNVDIETATSGVIVANDIAKIQTQIKQQYRNNARWLMSRATLQQIKLLKDDSGTAGYGRYLWQPSFQAGVPSMLDGFPVMESEFMPSITVDGDPLLAFGDFTRYLIVDRSDVSVRWLDQLYAASHQMGLQVTQRTDGGVTDKSGFVRLNRT